MPEIEQGLRGAAGRPVTVSFTPHLMPMNRGILSTHLCAAGRRRHGRRSARRLWRSLCRRGLRPRAAGGPGAGNASCARLESLPHGVFADRLSGRAILVSAIDNLVKGASGQAVQNMNVMPGLPETTALEQEPLFP